MAETEPPETEPLETEPPETEPPETQPSETEPPDPPVTASQSVVEPPSLTAQKAFVYDCQTGEYIYVLGELLDAVYPASTTKLFSCYLALQYLSPYTVVTVGHELDMVEWDSTVAGLQVGDTLTVETLIACVLLPSGGDAAYTLAAAAGRVIAGDDGLTGQEAVDVFVAEMNRKAEELGFENTNFVTCDGYHRDDHYISLSALLEIGKLCLEEPAIMNAVSIVEEDVTLENGRTLHLVNTNEVINPESDYYRANCVGIKTGQTTSAGSCLLAAFREGGRYVLIGVFKGEGEDGRFIDVDALYDAFVKTN